MHWNLMNYEELRTVKLLKLKYRKEDETIQTFYKIDSPQKLGQPSLICTNLETLKKVLQNNEECIEIYWVTIYLGP